MRGNLRRARASAVVLLVAVFLSVAAYAWVVTFDPRPWVALLLCAVPLVVPGLPAVLMLVATIRHGDPYDVSHRYPPGAHLGRSVGPPE